MDVFQVAQRAVDLDRAREFYSWLLEAEPTGHFDPPGLLFFQVGGTRLLLDRVAPSALVYLRVDDVRRTVQRCVERGVVVESEPHVIFRHEDDALGPAGTDEWMAFVTRLRGQHGRPGQPHAERVLGGRLGRRFDRRLVAAEHPHHRPQRGQLQRPAQPDLQDAEQGDGRVGLDAARVRGQPDGRLDDARAARTAGRAAR